MLAMLRGMDLRRCARGIVPAASAAMSALAVIPRAQGGPCGRRAITGGEYPPAPAGAATAVMMRGGAIAAWRTAAGVIVAGRTPLSVAFAAIRVPAHLEGGAGLRRTDAARPDVAGIVPASGSGGWPAPAARKPAGASVVAAQLFLEEEVSSRDLLSPDRAFADAPEPA